MALEIDKIWKGWKEDSFIGGGAFGKVYKITKEEFGHTYEAALKVISIPQNSSEIENVTMEGMDEEGVTEYFYKMTESIVKEVQLMSELKGITNIVSYEEHEIIPKEDGIGWDIYIRMEILTPLLTYLSEHPQLSKKEIIQLGIDMCTALEVCQQQNIIHRDIKPENIFISKNGNYKLGDFGIARQLERTSSGLSQKGTYTYMAPEVIKGLPYNATVDIYSLGIVMYRFLNKNRAPFMPPFPEKIFPDDRENANVMRISGKSLPKPCDADEALSAVVLKACAFEPSDRYANPTELKKALQNILLSENALEPLNEIKTDVPEQDATVALDYIMHPIFDPDETIPPSKLREEIMEEKVEASIVPEEKVPTIEVEHTKELTEEQLNGNTEKTEYMGNAMPTKVVEDEPQHNATESVEVFESVECPNKGANMRSNKKVIGIILAVAIVAVLVVGIGISIIGKDSIQGYYISKVEENVFIETVDYSTYGLESCSELPYTFYCYDKEIDGNEVHYIDLIFYTPEGEFLEAGGSYEIRNGYIYIKFDYKGSSLLDDNVHYNISIKPNGGIKLSHDGQSFTYECILGWG